MTSTIIFSSKDDFRTWQRKAQGLCMMAKDEELARIDAVYEAVIAAYASSMAESNRIIENFQTLLNSRSKNFYSWVDDGDVMEAHATAMGEIERINVRFQTKWGSQYEAYQQEIEALKKAHKKAMAQTRNQAAYKKAMAVLSARESREDGGTNA
jgi:hypothetical protein